MNRLARLAALARVAGHNLPSTAAVETQVRVLGALSTAAKAWTANFWSSAASQAASGTVDLMEDEEHATGLERQELESKARGVDPFHEAWLDAPFGTETSPVEVTSEFDERIVGVPDPDDDSLVWWGVIKAGEPPKQIIEDGEFFVLKKVPSTLTGGH